MLRLALLSLLALPLLAQDRIGGVQVRVSTDRPDWRYELGQPVRFRILAIQDGHPVKISLSQAEFAKLLGLSKRTLEH